MNTENNPNDTYHDFIRYRKPIKSLVAHTISRKNGKVTLKYKDHLVSILLAHAYIFGMAVTALVLTSDDKIVFFLSFHLVLLVMVGLTGLGLRVANDRELEALVDSLKAGVYRYGGEAEFEEQLAMRKQSAKECGDVARFFFWIIVSRLVCNVFIQPTMELLLIAHHDPTGMVINPYLPQPIYMPFSTRSYLGFCVAYVINVAFLTCIGLIVICQDEYYVSILLQIKAQLEVLNHALLNIQRRALSRFTADLKFNSIQELYDSKEFQKCIYSCIRAIVLHYQAILRLEKYAKAYTGANFLFIIATAAMALASLGLLILENPGSYVVGNMTLSLMTEMVFTLHFCWYGEALSTESSKVFHTLHEMLEVTRKPIEIKASILDFKARMGTFGDILSRVYQLMNVMRKTM